MEKLYERGIPEYLSIPLSCEHLTYVQEHNPKVRECSADGISKARNLFERAVTAAAVHVAQGSQIWEAYTQFEQAVLLTIDQSDIQAIEKQPARHGSWSKEMHFMLNLIMWMGFPPMLL